MAQRAADPNATVVPSRAVERIPLVVIDDGQRIELAACNLIGRAPVGSPSDDHPQLIALDDPSMSVSKTHLAIVHDGTGWFAEDRHSTNGVELVRADGIRQALTPGVPLAVTAGETFPGDLSAVRGRGSVMSGELRSAASSVMGRVTGVARSGLAKARSNPRSAGSAAVVGIATMALVLAIVLADGFRADSLDLDDSAVWVVNQRKTVFGRINTEIPEQDGVSDSTTWPGLDVIQDGSDVYVSTGSGGWSKATAALSIRGTSSAGSRTSCSG
jgi:hypothetical protein